MISQFIEYNSSYIRDDYSIFNCTMTDYLDLFTHNSKLFFILLMLVLLNLTFYKKLKGKKFLRYTHILIIMIILFIFTVIPFDNINSWAAAVSLPDDLRIERWIIFPVWCSLMYRINAPYEDYNLLVGMELWEFIVCFLVLALLFSWTILAIFLFRKNKKQIASINNH